ncbi:2-keto-4-pentenoate hydratase/2-oxohepta-3-ene-1,7-dioic acid hydratase (catechol pathway) [Pyrobaculum oguniense TE7]|uniref:2-keto-4-pentenoate hydratase/2-oxohepta-3-ene-1,7-dioic acid hydratase (Catechol pathway) n=1 Tax=Pyrobaculum oguniense (strain DSM 13380 / JCM 10595 / TE7) TaxID=698757 RepID=H6Q903_PYROT|nr:2-keto-4-pentenoate hydratase/2-oxohepta-3-ene-1,7-dioic acid hydratase (catechol pathway) [Pyrobaculum oguniense TE7]
MKIVRFERGGVVKYGVVRRDYVEVVDDLLKLTEVGESYRLTEVRLLAPLQPQAIFCALVNSPLMLGTSSVEEAREMLGPPKFFLKLTHVVVGPNEVVHAPRSGIRPEAELGVVVYKKLKHATKREVEEAIFGYTLFNDVTAPGEFKHDFYYAYRRDPSDGVVKKQLIRGPHFRNKNRDGFAPMGPWIVTPDELGDVSGVTLRSYYGGRLLQEGRISELIYSPVELIVELSKVLTIPPLSVVTTGTPGYLGVEDPSEFKLPAMRTVMAVEADKIGLLENPVEVEDFSN